MDQWRSLKSELNKEAQQIFALSGEIVLIESISESGTELVLSDSIRTLKLRHVPERNAVRWETDKEYGFERITAQIDQLARTLMKRLYGTAA